MKQYKNETNTNMKQILNLTLATHEEANKECKDYCQVKDIDPHHLFPMNRDMYAKIWNSSIFKNLCFCGYILYRKKVVEIRIYKRDFLYIFITISLFLFL